MASFYEVRVRCRLVPQNSSGLNHRAGQYLTGTSTRNLPHISAPVPPAPPIPSRKLQAYSSLLTLLHSSPRRVATLCTVVPLASLDGLLQTLMFTLYSNNASEDKLLLLAFQGILAAHFDEASEYTSLLRANTPVSRMMASYTRRVAGQEYLRAMFGRHIKHLAAQRDVNLEINPVVVSAVVSGTYIDSPSPRSVATRTGLP